jgi:hypothetical protein
MKIKINKKIGVRVSAVYDADQWAVFSGLCDQHAANRSVALRRIMARYLHMSEADRLAWLAPFNPS